MTIQKVQILLVLALSLSPSAWALTPEEAAAARAASQGNKEAQALPQCNICKDDITGERFICPSGHSTCANCVSDHVRISLGNPTEIVALRKNGLRCFEDLSLGTGAGGGTVNYCTHRHPFEEVLKLIDDGKKGTIHAILKAADEKPETAGVRGGAGSLPSGSDTDSGENPAVTELRKKVEDAFIFSCPACSSPAQEHDACCSVQCGNDSCKTYFCSLCFKNYGKAGSPDTHQHVSREHTGESAYEFRHDEFDERDEHGQKIRWSYEKRYHWLITRKKLASLITPSLDAEVKKKLLRSIKKTYADDYNLMMWPMPAALPTSEWLAQVTADPKMPPQKKIWLLQNEAIFLREAGDTANAALVDAAVKKRGAQFILSLDVGRGGARAAAGAVNPHITAVMAGADPRMTAYFQELQRDQPRFFALGGEAGRIYRITDPENRVPPFVLSDLSPNRMSHTDATRFCEERGASLPTKDQLEALERSMRHNDRYNPDHIAGMREVLFWSSPLDGERFAYRFIGGTGNVDYVLRRNGYRARCVQAAAW